MSEKPDQIVTLDGKSTTEFDQKVNELLKKGWVPLGGAAHAYTLLKDKLQENHVLTMQWFGPPRE